jgi:hypothetical protein
MSPPFDDRLRQVGQEFAHERAQADEMGHPHHQDADDRKRREEGEPIGQTTVHHGQVVEPAEKRCVTWSATR